MSKVLGRVVSSPETSNRSATVPMQKKICSRCVADWSGVDEEVWKDGWVFCPAAGEIRRCFEGIPEGCHMCLEYVLSGKNRK